MQLPAELQRPENVCGLCCRKLFMPLPESCRGRRTRIGCTCCRKLVYAAACRAAEAGEHVWVVRAAGRFSCSYLQNCRGQRTCVGYAAGSWFMQQPTVLQMPENVCRLCRRTLVHAAACRAAEAGERV